MKAIKMSVILMFVLLGAYLFYWFQLRPIKIRKNCEKASQKYDSYFEKRHRNNFYRVCLVQNGLKPESLFVNISEE